MNKRQTFLNLVLGLFLIGLIVSVSSCGDENDLRDEFVGSYDIEYNCVGTSFGDQGNPYSYEYFFFVEKSEIFDNALKLVGMPEGEITVSLSGSDFVGLGGSSISGVFMSNRIVFSKLGYHSFKDCDEDLPVTAYKR